MAKDRPIMSAKYSFPVTFGQNGPTRQGWPALGREDVHVAPENNKQKKERSELE